MKKILFTLLSIILLGAINVSAQTKITWSSGAEWNGVSEKAEVITLTKDGFVISAQGGTSTNPTVSTSSSDARFYAGCNVTITSAQAMTKIVFVISSYGKKRFTTFEPNSGNCIYDNIQIPYTVTWTGNATSVMFTVGQKNIYGTEKQGNKPGQICINEIIITSDNTPSNKTANPIISPKSGAYYEGQQIEITCATPGSRIMYSFGGSTFHEYTGPLTLPGNCTIQAYAMSSNMEVSDLVSETYTIKYPKTYRNIDEFLNKTDKETKAVISGEISVIERHGNSIYVQDNSGSLLIYDKNKVVSTQFTNGDIISGITGEYDEFNGLIEFIPTEEITVKRHGNPVQPEEIKFNKFGETQNSKYVKLTGLTVTTPDGKKYSMTDPYSGSDAKYSLYNKFNKTMIDGNDITVTGFIDFYKGNKQLLPETIVKEPVNKVFAPTFDPAGGNYPESVTVTISCATPGATIYYQKNPSVSPQVYNEPITLNYSCDLSAWATKDGMTSSGIHSEHYNIIVAADYAYKKTISNDKNYLLVADDVNAAIPGKANGLFDTQLVAPQDGYIHMNDNVFAFKFYVGANGKGSMCDIDGNYYFADTKSDEFQFAARNTIVIVDTDWKCEPQTNGTVKITHVETGKWIQYNAETKQFGVYNTTVGSLPKVYEEGAVADAVQVEPVTFDPAAGTVFENTEVRLACASKNAVIYYTMDGTNPTTSSDRYTAPIVLTENCTIKAIATESGRPNSDITEATYIVVKKGRQSMATFNFSQPKTLNPAPDFGTGNYVELNSTTVFYNNRLNLTVDVSDGNNVPRLYTNQLRFYNKNVITITTCDDQGNPFNIKKVEILGAGNDTESINGIPLNGNVWIGDAEKVEIKHIAQSKSELLGINVYYDLTTGVEDSEIKIATIFGTEGGVEISGIEGNVEIYNIYGQLVANEFVEGEATIATPAGLMIVKAGETVTKVLVK